MTLLAWNIQHGGGKRAGRVVAAIAEHSPDVIVLTEFRARSSAKIRDALRVLGWLHCESTRPSGTENGVCVLSRSLLHRVTALADEHSTRWLDVALPACRFGFSALHIITAAPRDGERPGEAKARFWDAVLVAAEQRITEPFLFIGDFNTGLPYKDETGSTFYCSEHFARLLDLGWIDVWRHFHGDRTEFSWYSRAMRNGFRVDHAFVTPSLLPRVRGCRYSHRERETGVSDHSILIVEVA